MTTPAPAGGGAREWVQTHQPQAAAGGGAVLVALYALYKRRAAARAAATDPNAAAAQDPNAVTAGLTGTPATGAVDIQNWVQDALNRQNADVTAQLAGAATPVTTVPETPVPAPRPGALRYKVLPGDTLRKIALNVYGRATDTSMTDIKIGNPILFGWNVDAPLTAFVGNTLTIPAGRPEPTPKPKPAPPKPKPVAKPKPKPKPAPRRRR